LLYVRQKLVLVAKAFQLQAIDLVHIDYKGFCDCGVIIDASNNRSVKNDFVAASVNQTCNMSSVPVC